MHLSDRPSPLTLRGSLFIALVAVSFAAIFIKLAAIPPLAMAFYRMAIAGGVLAALFGRQALRDFQALEPRLKMRLAFATFFLASHFACWISSLDYTSISSSVILLATQPIFGAWLGAKYFREPVARHTVWALLLSVAGCVLVGWGDWSLSLRALYGDILAVAACLVIAIYYGFGKEVRQVCSNRSFMTFTFLGAGCWLGLGCILTRTSMHGYTWEAWTWVAGAAAIPTLGGHFLFSWLVKFYKLATLNLSILSEPILTGFLAWLIWGSLVTLTQLGGFVLLAVAVFWEVALETRGQRRLERARKERGER